MNVTTCTVEAPLMITPNKGYPPKKGQDSEYQKATVLIYISRREHLMDRITCPNKCEVPLSPLKRALSI